MTSNCTGLITIWALIHLTQFQTVRSEHHEEIEGEGHNENELVLQMTLVAIRVALKSGLTVFIAKKIQAKQHH